MARKKKQAYVRNEWIFDWKRSTSTPFSSWFSILFVGGLFALMIVGLRVKVVQPVSWEAPQAGVIHLHGQDWSQALAMEARAKGPFPSRFEPAAWAGAEAMQGVIEQAAQPKLAAHQPRLLPFPDPGIQPPRMARRGEPVMPHRSPAADRGQDIGELRLQPVIRPLDGIGADELPETLPSWDQPVGEALAGRTWKFLVELEPSGRVRQSVSLAGGQELSPQELTQWLRGVVFPAKARDKGRRWMAVAIEFENRIKEQ